MVPVIVLTGFLGSGKTTLLNRLMESRPADAPGRMAIVVNELGDVGIDGDLLPADMTRQVELPGGCICCVLNEDLDKTILELVDSVPDLGLIVIETTGVAEPLPISWAFEREPLSERVRLASMITVVDAVGFTEVRGLSPAVDAQVEYADILVLSKVDLVGDTPPPALLDVLRELNPDAPQVSGTPDGVVASLWTTLRDPQLDGKARPGPADSAHHAHRAGHMFDTISLPIAGTLDYEELEEQLEGLPADYVRIKGIARVIDGRTGSSEPRLVAFHRVGTRVSYEPLATEAPTRVVALGRNLEAPALAACLEAAMLTSSDEVPRESLSPSRG